MDFWTRCTSKEGMSICMTGVLIGIIFAIILVFIYMKYSPSSMATSTAATSEYFVDPNAMDPQTAALLAMANAADPTSSTAMKKMYGIKG